MYLPKAIVALAKWADNESSRYALGCVRLKRANGTVFAEATDGRRLGRLTWEFPGDEREYGLPAKSLSKALRAAGTTSGGYPVGLNGTVTLFGRNTLTTVPHEELERWPKTEDVLQPAAGAGWWPIATRPLRDEARKALKDQAGGPNKPALVLEICGASMRLDARFVRDMCETAIQCGYERVDATATNKQSAVHFCADGEVKLECVIMPLVAD